jgi:molecular chaperone HtpG
LNIKVFIQYGIISEPNFYDRAKKFCLLKNTDGKYFTLDEYEKEVKKTQKDKEGNLIYLYTNNINEQYNFIEPIKDRGYDVLIMDGVIDAHFINTLEQKLEKTRFTRVDSDTVDKLIKKDEAIPSKLDDEQKKTLKEIIEKQVDKTKFTVELESMSESEQPMMIMQPEFMRRMKDMSALGGGMSYMGELPDHYNLIVNSNSPVIGNLLTETDETKQTNTLKHIFDLALLAQNLLKGKELSEFIKRSMELATK